MNESDKVRVWNTIRDFLMQSSRRLAYGQEPWVIYSSGRDDSRSTEQGLQTEERFSSEIDEFIRQFVTTREWPKDSKSIVRFYAGQRIAWACEFLRVVLTPSPAGDFVFHSPVLPGIEFIEWLLISAYNNRFVSTSRQPATDPVADSNLTTVWT